VIKPKGGSKGVSVHYWNDQPMLEAADEKDKSRLEREHGPAV